MVTLYHNPRCSKSRETLALLESNGVTPTIIRYLEQPPTAAELAEVLKKLGIGARDLLRKGEDEYKNLQLANPALTEAELIAAMIKQPKLIERPIAIKGKKAIIGRPPEAVLELL
ncbi:arsenate reductase (glutaredoxin) [Simiduia curdlanivorans]|uniref:Arsenate reductase n=1 Tax=Simiduia curdlanivorans TaxID=1492769 RepID=A0ABV8UZ33_9GAMM|nr:arsenate reductase (glutaredoxin) [Simiduia curdlanivorans]MDN3640454.1 arsenate reductase (glutaredoxin) [Simiduia curdlanivorans]